MTNRAIRQQQAQAASRGKAAFFADKPREANITAAGKTKQPGTELVRGHAAAVTCWSAAKGGGTPKPRAHDASLPGIALPRFDFHAFVASIGDRDHHAIIQAAEREADRVEKACRRGKGAVANRKAGSTEYLAQLDRLLFWLSHSAFPAGMTAEDKALYGTLAERLVSSGQYGPRALDAFR